LDQVFLNTIPVTFITPNIVLGTLSITRPFWPTTSETINTSLLLMDFPQVLASYPFRTNYRTLVNPDKVAYPLQDYPDISSRYYSDGLLVDGATPRRKQEPSVDWSLSDPDTAMAQALDYYRNHLDPRSY
jgi:hypothetical protein